jgi:uncharacterized protein (DUF697 family)/GTP-binding protein EngB required for normal cell division
MSFETEFSGKFAEEYEKYSAMQRKPSILVVGGTGTGKSTLINLVFKREIAKTGAGRPVTKGIDTYENDHVILYDSAGYETGEENQRTFNEMIKAFIAGKKENLETAVDLVWYCVSASSARFIGLDASLINALRDEDKKTVAVVITKLDIVSLEGLNALRQAIQQDCPKTELFESTTDPNIQRERGLDALWDWSLKNLPESRKASFLAASRRVLKKKEEGEDFVLQHVAGAALVGMSPIPFSDAPILIANQMGLLARLTFLWDMPALENLASGSVSGIILSNLGKSLAANLLKLIPGVGTLVGGVINAGVASALTYAFGMAVNELCYRATKAELAGEPFPLNEYFNKYFADMVKNIFNEKYKQTKI